MNGQSAEGRPIRVMHLRQAAGGGGGADEVILNIMSNADRDRFEVSAAFLRHRRQDLSPLAARFAGRGLSLAEHPGGKFFDPRQLAAVRAAAVQAGVEIVHCHDPKSDLYGLLLKKSERVKIVSTIHGWIEKTWKVRLYNRIDRALLGRFDKLVAVSDALAETARRKGLSAVDVVPNGVDVGFWSAGKRRPTQSDPEVFTVGFAGRLSPEKGCADLLAVAARVGDGFRFLIAGEGEEEGRLRAEAERRGLGSRAVFLGYLDRLELRRFYGDLDALLLPSLSEGMPMAVLEAAAAGVPVVATDVGGVGEVLKDGDNGFLVAAGDVEGMAKKVQLLQGRRDLGSRLAQRGREVVEARFSVRASVERMEAVYLALRGG